MVWHSIASAIDANGFAIVESVLSATRCAELIEAISSLPIDDSTRQRNDQIFAKRNLFESPAFQMLANSVDLRSVIDPILGPKALAVRGILFDKNPAANWIVPWHQDRSIAVRERVEIAGYSPWSRKAGVVHVQPPLEVLLQMLTVRIHLDRCDSANGPLRVIPGTHKTILSPNDLAERVNAGPVVDCAVEPGGALLMRPLLVHGSLPAAQPSHRRVLHIEYAAYDLPDGLRWHREDQETDHARRATTSLTSNQLV